MVTVCENALREGGWREGDGGTLGERKIKIESGRGRRNVKTKPTYY